jgi:transcriptional regulator with XRE-family HTH domain
MSHRSKSPAKPLSSPEKLSSPSPTLAEVMHRQGVTQMEISGALGIHQSYVSLICSGKRVPSLSTSKRMAAYLGVTLDEWWGLLKRRGKTEKTSKPAKPATKKRRK